MATLFDPDSQETMVYCDSPENCGVHCSLGFRNAAGFIVVSWMEVEWDFCSIDCMIDWGITFPPMEEYEDE